MNKIFLFMLSFILSVNFSLVSAEQSKAEEYRQIFSSGNFYVEYEDKDVKRIIAEEDGRRMSKTNLLGKYKAVVSVLNPLGALFAGKNEKHPEFMHCNHRYYKFLEDNFAISAKEEQLNDENLDPSEEWSAIDKFLSLPDELAIFNWNDKYHKISAKVTEPIFSESIKKNLDGKSYDCDRYTSTIKNTQINFDVCYENGEIISVQSAFFFDGKEYPINTLNIKKIVAQIPQGAIKLNSNAKIYAAGIGDMNDLLENPVFIGKLQDVIK